jgi:hypothetical protein
MVTGARRAARGRRLGFPHAAEAIKIVRRHRLSGKKKWPEAVYVQLPRWPPPSQPRSPAYRGAVEDGIGVAFLVPDCRAEGREQGYGLFHVSLGRRPTPAPAVSSANVSAMCR